LLYHLHTLRFTDPDNWAAKTHLSISLSSGTETLYVYLCVTILSHKVGYNSCLFSVNKLRWYDEDADWSS